MSQGSQSPALDQAFKALEHYKQGDDPEVLAPIEQAVRQVHGNPAARAALEQRLTAHLGAPFSGAARKFVCRELAVIGSAAAVPALAPLLLDQDLSHMARYAIADALLISAERLIASGERGQAVKLLEALTDPSQAPHVRAAANRALSAAMRP